MGLAVFGLSVPVFVLGYVLIYLFAIRLGWLPVQGYVSLAQGLWPCLRSILLPSVALGSIYMALIARITRAVCWRCWRRTTSGPPTPRACRP